MRSVRKPVSSDSNPWKKRQDIQLLRAVSVIAVVGYHFGLAGFDFGFLGVDVFLVISGYLVGGGLLNELKTSGQIDVRRFFTRRINRLLPASIVVIVLTTLLLYASNALTTRDLRHALWSSLYVQNLNLSFEGGDYLGQDLLPTYFVHFWSLSLEEQFYLFVPIILILIAKTRFTQRPLLIFYAIGVGSLIFSLYQTHIGDASAYFSLSTRAWQFILGMAVANLKLSRTYSLALWVISILGLGVFTALINLNLTILFPAPGAIIPSLITTLALVAGKVSPLKIPISSFQSLGVLLGDLSYSIYLVHFPISIIWSTFPFHLFFVIGGLILTFTLACLLKVFVEDPIRYQGFSRPRFKITGVKLLLVNLALALSIIATIQAVGFTSTNQSIGSTDITSATPEHCLGANAITKDSCEVFISAKPLFAPESANESIPNAYSNGCHIGSSSNPQFKSCDYGTTEGYKTTIALVGDSHATQWLPAFDLAGKASGVRIKTFLMSGCAFGAVIFVDNCKDFSPWVLSSIAEPDNSFSAIYISNRVSTSEVQTNSAYLKQSFSQTLESLSTTEAKIFLIGDIPLGSLDDSDPNLCLLTKEPMDCFDLIDEVKWNNPFAEAIQESGVGEHIPLDRLFCMGTKCYKSIGGVPVYRDSHHISVYYSESSVEIWKTRFEDLLKPPGVS
jgi:peptidoglycan/LPS O-acetylase OafA/YrhL